ncbi:MAG: hypothetical protein IT459_02565, partial [Planctomycetes bacterium]|nr:hypothetical protein [Planctomycetota bacterium]
DLDGDGAAEVAILSQNQPFAPSTSGRLRFVRASAGSLLQAAQADGCSVSGSPVSRPALVISGCLESSGTIRIDAYGMGDPLLFVSAITGSIPLPGSCALTIGLPAIVVPLPKTGDHDSLSAHLPSFSMPVTLHLQSTGWQNSASPNLAATGRSTLTLP